MWEGGYAVYLMDAIIQVLWNNWIDGEVKSKIRYLNGDVWRRGDRYEREKGGGGFRILKIITQLKRVVREIIKILSRERKFISAF